MISGVDDVYKVINWIKERLYLLMWARNNPKKDIIDYYFDVSKKIWLPLKVRIDDVTPSLLYGRSQEQQLEYNNAYLEYMKNNWIDSDLVSNIKWFSRWLSLDHFVDIMQYTKISDLTFILPEKKKSIDNLLALEFIHYFIQNELLHLLSQNDVSFLIGKFSAWLYYNFNNNQKHISFIILNKI